MRTAERVRLRRRIEALHRDGSIKEALVLARRFAELSPGRDSFFWLGLLLRDSGRCSAAIRAFRDALRHKNGPRDLIGLIYLHKAHTWYLLDNRKEMLLALSRAKDSRLKPRHWATFHVAVANAHYRRGQLVGAYKSLEAALQEAPLGQLRGSILRNMANILIQQGNLSGASRQLSEALIIHRNAGNKVAGAKTQMMRAIVLFEQGDTCKSIKIMRRCAQVFACLGKSDLEAEALQNTAYFALEAGTEDEKIAEMLDRAVVLSCASGQTRVQIRSFACRAILNARLGNLQSARRDLEEAQQRLQGTTYPIGMLHFLRAKTVVAKVEKDWNVVRKNALSAERLAGRLGDLARVTEFRRVRAEAEQHLSRPRARMRALNRAEFIAQARPKISVSGKWWIEAQKWSRISAPLLIVGESGTGKTRLAKTIHDLSPRFDRPFVIVPCETLEFPARDLYGNDTGAWTDAHGKSLGYVRQAADGTVVLDRVDELSVEHQRILIPLFDNRARPVGGAIAFETRARIIATARDPSNLMPSLRSRFGLTCIHLSPLRARRDEIPQLVRELLGSARKISADALVELTRQDWEGNIAQLQAVIQRLVAMSGGTIGVRDVQKVSYEPISG